MIQEQFMDTDSEEEPDEKANDSDSSFVPEEENSDWDGGDADRPSCLHQLIFFLNHPH